MFSRFRTFRRVSKDGIAPDETPARLAEPTNVSLNDEHLRRHRQALQLLEKSWRFTDTSNHSDATAKTTASISQGSRSGSAASYADDAEEMAEDKQREQAWETETQQLFLHRTQVLCLLSITVTPLFWFAHTRIAPQAFYNLSIANLMLVASSLVIFWLARYSRSYLFARRLALLLYGILGWSAAIVIALAGDSRISAFSGHQQILISILFMPFSLREAAICAALITLSFTLGLGDALSEAEWEGFIPHILSFALSGAMISIMANLQSQMRRRAFDSNYALAISAAHNAQLSTLDSITGGWNRRYLEISLNKELKRVVRFHQPVALLMFDLDNFKYVNDQLGHPVGDIVLREVHAAVLHTLRQIDTVARYGGDEFAVILPGLRAADALQMASRLSDYVSQHLVEYFGADSLPGQVTISVGIAIIPAGETLSFLEAVQRADQHLYEAKRAGKNRIRIG